MISVLILTKNEEKDLPQCLASVQWCDDVHVLDSGSTDATLEVARRHGARLVVRAYPGDGRLFGGDEAAHRNWSLHGIGYKHPWVLMLDADERVTPGLKDAIFRAVESPQDHVAFRIQRRDFLEGTWLRHVQASPFYLRLVRPERIRFERLVNCVSVPDGPVGAVSGYLDHHPFSKGISHWLDRHNAYSSLEARQTIENRRLRTSFSIRRALLSGDFHERRLHQKELFYRLPLRPFAKFLILYLLKRGFLDGRAGFRYAVLQSIYEYMIVLKVRELELEMRRSGSVI